MKIIVVILGLILIVLVILVDKLGQVYELSLTLSSVTNGTMLGIFTMGMVCRSANSKGVVSGAVFSVVVVGFAIIGAQNVKEETMLPMRIDGCNLTTSTTYSMLSSNETSEKPFWLFRISFMYYSFIGFVLVFIIGYPVSLITGKAKQFDEILLLPFKRVSTEYERL